MELSWCKVCHFEFLFNFCSREKPLPTFDERIQFERFSLSSPAIDGSVENVNNVFTSVCFKYPAHWSVRLSVRLPGTSVRLPHTLSLLALRST